MAAGLLAFSDPTVNPGLLFASHIPSIVCIFPPEPSALYRVLKHHALSTLLHKKAVSLPILYLYAPCPYRSLRKYYQVRTTRTAWLKVLRSLCVFKKPLYLLSLPNTWYRLITHHPFNTTVEQEKQSLAPCLYHVTSKVQRPHMGTRTTSNDFPMRTPVCITRAHEQNQTTFPPRHFCVHSTLSTAAYRK